MKYYYVVDHNEDERIYAGPFATVSGAQIARISLDQRVTESQRLKMDLWIVLKDLINEGPSHLSHL